MSGTPRRTSAGAISVASVMYAGVASSPIPTIRLTIPTKSRVRTRSPSARSTMKRENLMPTPDSSSAPIMMPTAAVIAAIVIQRTTASSKAETIRRGVSQCARSLDRKLTATTNAQL